MTIRELVPALSSYFIWTIGCQMNVADSERLESALLQLGLKNSLQPQDADVIVLNSCVVRQSAEDKVVGMLSSLKPLKSHRPDRVVALMGCMVGHDSGALKKQFPYVDVFMRPQQYQGLLELLGDRMGIDAEGCLSTLVPPRASVTAFIPIIHGCDKFCTFCIIPYRRGRERSRPVADIVLEAELLAARGVKEVTLLGQNVDSYGNDLSGNGHLADLLAAVSEVDGLERVRFLTSHPNDMSGSIIDAVASLDKVCEHINLPFQSGDDDVLAAMRRGYTAAQYRNLVDRIRATVPRVSISTDLIVGFPGEGEAAFQRSVDMLETIRFVKVHAAAYSPRPGTIAARKMQGDVSAEEMKRRMRVIESVQERISTEINATLLNTTQEVLVENLDRGKWRGRTRNDKLVFFGDARDLQGKAVKVTIERTSPWSLQGTAED